MPLGENYMVASAFRTKKKEDIAECVSKKQESINQVCLYLSVSVLHSLSLTV